MEDYRATALQAVQECLPKDGLVASQLSGGRDSSAVTAMAAHLAPGRVTAITFKPLPGSVGEDNQHLIFDESVPALRTANYLGIDHLVVDGGSPESQLDWLRKIQRWTFLPPVSAVGAGLRMAVADAAARAGAEVMLIGAMGNLGLSGGGLPFLADLRSEEETVRWWRVARYAAEKTSLRTVANHSLPVRLRQRIWAARFGRPRNPSPLWRGPLLESLDARPFSNGFDRSAREELRTVLDQMDMADFTPWVFHGIQPRDPTANLRLIELCLQVPARLLVDETLGRPLFEQAFAGLLPPELLGNRRKGRQAADWWLALRPELIRDTLEELSQVAVVSDAIDVRRAVPFLKHWPRTFAEALSREDDYHALLGTLSLALFLAENFKVRRSLVPERM
ncbi:hypothetical protein GCM10022280_17940 [Sphingomonas swuensis]|uniref:Asparagine synthetase domain-containing protein n=1 Tax=Sphingomonas swuensis TaxID=977800 RepID=A0ABP7SZU8_9SPHN